MDCSEGNDEGREKAEKWDRCMKQATWKIGIGMALGGAISAFMGGNEFPLRTLTGLMVAWSFNSCRRQLTAPPPPPPPHPCEVDPCRCCETEYEPLIQDQFEGCRQETWDQNSNSPQSPQPNSQPGPTHPEEEIVACTCNPGQVREEPPVSNASRNGSLDHGECNECTCGGVS